MTSAENSHLARHPEFIETLDPSTPDEEGSYARLGWEAMERTWHRRMDVVIMRKSL